MKKLNIIIIVYYCVIKRENQKYPKYVKLVNLK